MTDDPALHLDGLTDIGNRRRTNEDAWWVGQLGPGNRSIGPGDPPLFAPLSRGPALLLVSDGVGGANAGEVASQMTAGILPVAMARQAGHARASSEFMPVLRRVLEDTNRLLIAQADEPGCEGMGATVSVLGFTADGRVCWAQVGDSRIYLFRDQHLRQLSRDHSPVGRMRQSGQLTEAEARAHPFRNQIDQSLGDPTTPLAPDTGSESFQHGDLFLVCSDGLTDGLWDHEIEGILARLQTARDVRPTVRQLVAQAKASSGRDNITVALALVESGPTSVRGWRRWLKP